MSSLVGSSLVVRQGGGLMLGRGHSIASLGPGSSMVFTFSAVRMLGEVLGGLSLGSQGGGGLL